MECNYKMALRGKYLIYNIEAGEYFEYFLIASVATLLGIRFYLDITGYPQIGGGGLHIAHMLWGGLLMLFSIIFLLTFLNRSLLRLIAVVAGIGFGTFIDELGKFITSDNNYFFEPTYAIIYIIFIVLFLLFRYFEKTHTLSKEEYLSNAFELVRQLTTEKTDPQIKEHARQLLKKSDSSSLAVKSLLHIILHTAIDVEKNKSFIEKLQQEVKTFYLKILGKKSFTRGVILFFATFSLFNLWRALDVISLYFRLEDFSLSFIDQGKFFSSLVSSVIILVGIIAMQFSNMKGYKLFKLGVLFSLFVTQFFYFYNDQLAAAGIFIINIFLLLILNFIIQQKSMQVQL